MPLKFLREIEAGTLPKQVTKPGDIDLLRLLLHAGMIDAELPDAAGSGLAMVNRVTGFGRAWLAADESSAKTSIPSSALRA
ncbi:hypothetical protein [Acidovorax sp. LjRoot194]|uniref:hypothetical protein n=1 Tax=Acidovorax sp. LjRoot194 TaxID=3342280 RepID=UPI003ECE8BB0